MVRKWPAFFLSFSFSLICSPLTKAQASAADTAKPVQKTVPADTVQLPPPNAASAPSARDEDLENEAENEFLNSSEAPDADDIELEN